MTELTKAPQTKSLFQPAVKYPEDIFSNDADLINPVNWSKI